jgi:predicted O-linked N-acetylglucosamine transferase (SPINDLY family)
MNALEKKQLLEMALNYYSANELKNSEYILRKVIKSDPNSSKANEYMAYIYDRYGFYEDSYLMLEKACSQQNCSGEALYQLGSAQLGRGLYNEALSSFKFAIKKKGEFFEALHDLGTVYAILGNAEKGLSYYTKCLKINANSEELFFNTGRVLDDLGRYEDALLHYEKAIKLQPNFIGAWINKGINLNGLERYDEALNHYEKAIRTGIDCPEIWLNRGVTLNYLMRYTEALVSYDKAIQQNCHYVDAWFNKGVTLSILQQYESALKQYSKAIELRPNFVEAWLNKGIALNHLKRDEEALAHFDMAIKLKPNYAEAWSNKGLVLNNLKRHEEALVNYSEAIKINSDLPFLLGDWAHTKMRICDWSEFDESTKKCINGVTDRSVSAQPFTLLSMVDDPDLHKLCAQRYIENLKAVKENCTFKKKGSSKIMKIGYYSADFHNHATSHLMARLFELHDSSRFEIHGFSFGPNINDALRLRVSKAFTKFHLVNHMSDLEIALFSRETEIDIAIDLKGFTQDARMGVFLNRCAPIQVNYLGYPGTLGTDCFDYIIADKTVIPRNCANHYFEKIAYLPNCYQVNDSNRKIANKQYKKSDFGLPDVGFVFCCFNNSYKILPEIFDLWIEILKSVDGSVLWLLEDNLQATKNLKAEARKRGIRDNRLIFAPRISLDEHLARHQLADLFLDTLPYNAHTTASDALWTGLPVLTLIGRSFASRVAASLLNAIGLPELITTTREEYVVTAIELANNPKKLLAIKQKLANNRLSAALFDTSLFAKNIEIAYTKMHERYLAGLGPDHILIEQ